MHDFRRDPRVTPGKRRRGKRIIMLQLCPAVYVRPGVRGGGGVAYVILMFQRKYTKIPSFSYFPFFFSKDRKKDNLGFTRTKTQEFLHKRILTICLCRHFWENHILTRVNIQIWYIIHKKKTTTKNGDREGFPPFETSSTVNILLTICYLCLHNFPLYETPHVNISWIQCTFCIENSMWYQKD